MATINEMLAELNTLRQLRGFPVLKGWKESRAKLEAAIQRQHDALADAKPIVEEAVSVAETAAEAPAAKRVARRGKKPTKAAEAPAAMSIVAFAELHSLNAKVVRARARKHAAELDAFREGKHVYVMNDIVIGLLKGKA